jgi:hypothetical protein
MAGKPHLSVAVDPNRCCAEAAHRDARFVQGGNT